VFDIKEIDKISQLLPSNQHVVAVNETEDPRIQKVIQGKMKIPIEGLSHRIRSVKSENEIKQLKHIAEISALSFAHTIASTPQMQHEKDIETNFQWQCLKRGAERMAYIPVVAGGERANTLHYIDNNRPLSPSDLVLVDAGGEVDGYVADISRTFPVSGRFSEAQKEIYRVVLMAEEKCIEAAKVGSSLSQLQALACRLLSVGLQSLGISSNLLSKVYPHMIGHYVGMDVHDCRTFSVSAPLLHNTYITIEPGLYIPNHPDFPPESVFSFSFSFFLLLSFVDWKMLEMWN